MADRGLYYGSLGRQALASSYAALDGVPFKISSNFRQPPKVISHPVFESSGNCTAFDEEYSFETEEAVLAWARARDEAIKKAKLEEAEKAAEAIAAQKKAALTQNEASTDSESDDSSQNEPTFPNSRANHSNNTAQGISQNQCSNQSQVTQQTVVPKPPIPKPAPRIGSILKPIPIQQTNKASDGSESSGNKSGVPTSASKERFDITMFEQERDPFDDLELQTVNDMEELKALLDPPSNLATAGKEEVIQSKETNQMNIPASGSDSNLNTSESLYELAAPITSNTWVTFDNAESSQTRVSPALSTDSNKGGMIASNSDSPVSDAGDYVKLTGQIQPPNSFASNVNGMTAQPSSDLLTNISAQGNPFGSQLPSHLGGTGLFKAVLPPIPKPRQSALTETGNNSMIPQSIPDQANSAVMSASPLSNSSQDAHKTDPSYFSGVKQTNGYNGFKPTRVAPPPPVPKSTAGIPQSDNSRMWSSVGPSLAGSLDNSKEETNSTNPYSRHSREWHGLSNSPDLTQSPRSSPNPTENITQSPSSSQLWNRYRPLPPAPSPKPGDIQAIPPLRPPSHVMGLTDPYYSLSKDCQAFTDRITTMGFLRAKVARAVEKFGQDEKEVIDHLIAVDSLEQKKFAPLYAEIALHKCQNDCEKAELFLQMQSQFEELGFSREKIQDALVQSDMNHDKALDLLTACAP